VAEADRPVPLEEVVPHQGRALLLDRVEETDDTSTCGIVEIDAGSWLRRPDGSVPAWVGLEYMAQCIAAHEGYQARREGRELQMGFLVRARSVRFRRARFAPGDVLRVRVWRLRGRPGLGVLTYRAEIRHVASQNAPAIAEAELTVALTNGG